MSYHIPAHTLSTPYLTQTPIGPHPDPFANTLPSAAPSTVRPCVSARLAACRVLESESWASAILSALIHQHQLACSRSDGRDGGNSPAGLRSYRIVSTCCHLGVRTKLTISLTDEASSETRRVLATVTGPGQRTRDPEQPEQQPQTENYCIEHLKKGTVQ